MAAGAAFAQGTTATISGNVTDAVVPPSPEPRSSPPIWARTVLKPRPRRATAVIRAVPPDRQNYKVEVSAPGFKKFERTGITLDVNRNARIDRALQVGAMTESVEVTGDAPIVETSVPGLGQTVTNTEIDNLPLVNRDIYTLLNSDGGRRHHRSGDRQLRRADAGHDRQRLPELRHRLGQLQPERRKQHQRFAQYGQRGA